MGHIARNPEGETLLLSFLVRSDFPLQFIHVWLAKDINKYTRIMRKQKTVFNLMDRYVMRRENLLRTQRSFGTLKSAVLCPKQTVECYSFRTQCLKTEYVNTKFLLHNLYGFVHRTA